MKAEINSQNKEKFFGLYWGQMIKGHPYMKTMGQKVTIPNFNIPENDHYLELKPLSSISDEDAIAVFNIYVTENNYPVNDYKIGKLKDAETHLVHLNNDFFDTKMHIGYRTGRIWFPYENSSSWKMNADGFDYLRSKGYALPWMGLSVEEMIEANWIKLQP